MLRKLSFVAGLIVYSMSAKIIMRYSIARDTIFLLQYLRLSGLRDLQGISFLVEVLVILISCSYVGLVLFKAHFEVCYSVCLRTLCIRFLLLLEFARTVSVIGRSLIRYLGCFG